MGERHHLSLSLGRELWNDMLTAALPVKLVEGEFDLARNTRQVVQRLRIQERVAGLLEDRKPPATLVRVKDRAKSAWLSRRERVAHRVERVVRVEGAWRVEVDSTGTRFVYGRQRVTADAFVRGTAEGTLFLLRENVELPFLLSKRLGASLTLGDIHYDKSREQVIGTLGDLRVDAGESTPAQLLSRLAEYLLTQQLPRANPVPILKREQVEDMVGGLGGLFRVNMGVEDIELVVDDEEMTLRVRFGFTQKQLTEQDLAGDELY